MFIFFIIEFPMALKRLLKNKLLMYNNLSGIFYILGASGYITYISKYMEVQFQDSAIYTVITGKFKSMYGSLQNLQISRESSCLLSFIYHYNICSFTFRFILDAWAVFNFFLLSVTIVIKFLCNFHTI